MKILKTKNKLISIAILLIAIIAMATNANAQPVTGVGTAGKVPVWTGVGATSVLGNSIIQDNGTNVGIGLAPSSYKLDVSGDANIANTSAFRIGGYQLLWHNGNTNDIFVGFKAGNATMTGHSNTLMGNTAGNALTSGAFNTYMGWNAGLSSTTDSGTTFIGYEAGKSNTTANYSTAIGYQALRSNAVVLYNTAVGYQALYSNNSCGDCYANSATNTAVGYQTLYHSQAYGGTCVGFWAGTFNSTGCGTTAFGEEALKRDETGNYNTGVGVATLHWNKTGNLNTCVGYNAGAGGSGSDTVLTINHSNDCFFGAYAGDSVRVDSDNVFMGYASGFNNSYASENVAVGYESLYSQSYNGGGMTGQLWSSYNTAIGNRALYSNQPTSTGNGIRNSALGYNALGSNTTGAYNTASGFEAINTNTTGSNNTASGYQAIYLNTTGSDNTTSGYQASYSNTTASNNSAFGYQALYSDSTGFSNTAIGNRAGYSVTKGDSDVFVGAFADIGIGGLYTNCAAFGYGASVTASDKFVFGNSKITVIGGQVGWSTLSDGRFKINVKNENIGLDFINKLRPVTYNLDTKAFDAFVNQNRQQQTDSSGKIISMPQADFTASTNIVHSGFIAQEVDSVSKACGFTSSIVSAPANPNDPYALNYAEFVVPLVKAVQQLDSMNTRLAAKMQTQDSIIGALQNQISQCCASGGSSLRKSDINNNNNNAPQQETVQQLELASLSNSVILYQNEPNPFGESTVIRYFVPENIQNVVVVFYDEFGREINRAQVQQNGYGSLQISSANLANGIYSYSIMANGQVVDTKRMLRAK